MIRFQKGNLLDADVEALVNTVNTVGIMGKGIALQFKEMFPGNYKNYEKACKAGEIKIGKMLVFRERTLNGERIIINFPTKTEWFRKSSYKFIEEGLKDLIRVIRELKIKHIAIPPLGCGNGRLQWERVKSLMEKSLEELTDVDIVIYEPNEAVKKLLQQQETNQNIKLTPARAMLLHALFHYEALGEEASVFAANKLAYFLQRSGEKLRLQFQPYIYGPYAIGVEKVLYALNGKYLRGLEQMKAAAFEQLQLEYGKKNEVEEFVRENLTHDQKQRLENLFQIIEGFESPLSLEVLSSVDFLLQKNPAFTEKEIFENVRQWNERKKHLIKEQYVTVAMNHLKQYGLKLNIA